MTDQPGERSIRPSDELDNQEHHPERTESSLDDETPGSQGEIEAGSEGDFGRQDERGP